MALGNFRVPNAEKDEQTTWNLHGQREPNPRIPNANYIPLACVMASVGHYRIALGMMSLQWASVRIEGFLDINMLVSATQTPRIGAIPNAKTQRKQVRVLVEYRLNKTFLAIGKPFFKKQSAE